MSYNLERIVGHFLQCQLFLHQNPPIIVSKLTSKRIYHVLQQKLLELLLFYDLNDRNVGKTRL